MTHISEIIKTNAEQLGQKVLANSIHSDADANKVWLMLTHKCPECNKIIKDAIEWEATLEFGHCLGCDHVRGETIEYLGDIYEN